MPNIEGLSEWAERFPDRIIHSRQYRRPEPLSNQTVLVVGAKVGAISIPMNWFSLIRDRTAEWKFPEILLVTFAKCINLFA